MQLAELPPQLRGKGIDDVPSGLGVQRLEELALEHGGGFLTTQPLMSHDLFVESAGGADEEVEILLGDMKLTNENNKLALERSSGIKI